MPLKLGIIANEFFDLNLGPGRMGGFGWAARQVSRIFADPSLDTTIVYFTGELIGSPPGAQTIVHGRPLILRQPTVKADFLRARSESPDLVLMVDYRPTYRWIFQALPTTPVIVWVRDPRPPDDVAKVASLRIPGAGDELPLSALQPDCSSLGSIARDSLGLPIVCFEGSGGAPQLVEDDAGFVVPYLDLDAAADRLALLMDDPALRHRLGEQAASKMRGRYTLKHMGHDLGAVLDRYVAGSHVSG